jgi:hypothetical protein
MKKLCLFTAILLLSSAWVVAQDNSQAGSSSSPSSTNQAGTSGSSQTSSDQAGTYNSSQTSSNASQTTIEGCLSGSGGNYTLTDNSGKTYQLQGDTSKLSEHVGHEVRIKGTETGASASSNTPSGVSASASTSGSGNNPSSSSASNPSSSASSPAGSASAAIQFNVKSVKHVATSCKSSSMNK